MSVVLLGFRLNVTGYVTFKWLLCEAENPVRIDIPMLTGSLNMLRGKVLHPSRNTRILYLVEILSQNSYRFAKVSLGFYQSFFAENVIQFQHLFI